MALWTPPPFTKALLTSLVIVFAIAVLLKIFETYDAPPLFQASGFVQVKFALQNIAVRLRLAFQREDSPRIIEIGLQVERRCFVAALLHLPL